MNPTLPTREVLLQKLRLEALPIEMQDEALEEIGKSMFLTLCIEILEKLPDPEREDFKELVELGKGHEAETLAAAHIPNFSAFMEEESKKILEGYITAATSVG